MPKTKKHKSKGGFIGYFSSAFEEFSKITWPTKQQAALLTAIVLSVSLILSAVIGAFDLGLSEAYIKVNEMTQGDELTVNPESPTENPDEISTPVEVNPGGVTVIDSEGNPAPVTVETTPVTPQ